MTQAYVFVPLTGEEASVGRTHSLQLIRAHVTRRQHAKSNAVSAMHTMQPWTVIPYRPRRQSSHELRAHESTPQKSGTDDTREGNTADPTYHHLFPANSVPTFLGSGRQEDPFWTYPGEFQSKLSLVLAHYIENIAVNVPELDETGQLRRQWFPLAMTEPATMYAILLVAASHYYAVRGSSDLHQTDLLQLKSRALAEINTVLSASPNVVSDAVIGAVMKMAAYEAIFGDAKVYGTHMRGLRLMIKMRGGLDQLGLDGFLERMIVWIDVNAAHMTGSTRITGGEDLPTKVIIRRPDPLHFTGVP